MLYSKSAHQSGTSGFFFPGDKNAPSDAIQVAEPDMQAAINLPLGSAYDFDAAGKLTVTAPTSAVLLSQAKTTQIGILSAAYQAAISVAVSYTTKAAVKQTFQADPQSVVNLQAMINAFSGAQATPAGFYWLAADNTQVAFTFADLQGLGAAMGAQGWGAFQHLQTQKAAVMAATTVAQVQALIW